MVLLDVFDSAVLRKGTGFAAEVEGAGMSKPDVVWLR
jgi:hypothetical protein